MGTIPTVHLHKESSRTHRAAGRALILTKPALKYTQHAVRRSAARIRRLGERRWIQEELQGSVGTPHSEGALALFDLVKFTIIP